MIDNDGPATDPTPEGISGVLAGAQARALKGGSPVIELKHLRRELAVRQPMAFKSAMERVGLEADDLDPVDRDDLDRSQAPGTPHRTGFDPGRMPGMQELQVSGEVADLLGSLDKGDLAASVDVLCDRVAQREATVRPSVPSVRPAEDMAAPPPRSNSEWHDGALDLTGLAESHSLDPLIGRQAELGHMTRVLLRRRKRNPLLVGPAGVGKTALVEGLAQRIVSGDVPPAMRSWRVIALSVPKLLAGTSYRGEFEARLEDILKRATTVDETHILFIDEFDLVVTAGAAKGGIDAASILKPYMARGDLVVIGACTEGDRSETIMADPALRRRMAVIAVDELDPAATRAVLDGMRRLMEQHHGVTISDQTLDACVRRAGERGVGHRPDNALEILDDACAHAVLTSGSDGRAGPPIEVSAAHVEAVSPDP